MAALRTRFWSYIKSVRKDTSGISPLKDQGLFVSDPKGKAEILNRQYSSVFTKEDYTNIPDLGDSPYPDMPPFTITSPGVEKLLAGLNPHKACGPDGLPPKILKELATPLAPILAHIFDNSIRSGTVPNDWKTANITPVFKKGERFKPSNYRPVSLTCICSKLLEHIVTKNILNHLETHSILQDCQHGFRSRRSCETQLVTFVQELAHGMSVGQQTDIVIMDFSKAFDKVPHSRLLQKLDHYGIRGNTLNWVRSFLTGRQQRVVVDGESSTYVPVESGVPQGTVLGPTLFLLFINDLPESTLSPVRMFADDCIVYRSISSQADVKTLQADLDHLHSWETDWQMEFNPDKCKVMHITRSRKPFLQDYTLAGTTLECVDTSTYLGVDLSTQLDWDPHINKIINKSNRTLDFIKRNLQVGPNVSRRWPSKHL
jgi:hypothetical protein